MEGSRLAKRYVLGERLGEGGMGVVYRATDLRTGGPVAVKLLPPALAHSAVWRQRLQREAKLAAGLSSPRVVRVLDLFDHQGTPVLVMEYVAGDTLVELLRRRGRLPVAEAVDLAREIARALAAAHAQGVIHRDLKPANIKLVEGQVKVLDFGLARLTAGDGLSGSGGYLGTPEYSAPEQAEGQADERTDVYALGVVLYELLRGQPPFRGASPLAVLRQHVEAAVPPLPAEVPKAVRAVVARCLAKDPSGRYQSAAELAEALAELQRRLGARRSSPPSAAAATLDLPPADGAARSGRAGLVESDGAKSLSELSVMLSRLPVPLTSFVGREREVAEIGRLLATTRLLTLTGTGGIGKTRLALQAATELLGSYPDGVWLVELAPLADPALVPQAVATAVGVREQPGRPLQQTLAEALRDRRLLLVLDNCEHLVGACARLADSLLRTCPQLQVLATSREPLGIAGEAPWRVPSLGLLDAQDGRPLPPTPQVAQVEAVRLFVARAASAQPGFALTDQNARAVAEICQRLDGIPLALELAAARVRVVPVEQLLGRLSDRFRLLTGGSRTALERHQTLRATVDWSYDLLSTDERRLFTRLSAFAGGFTLEAAEAVCSGEGVALEGVLELLTYLVDKSLVVVVGAPDGTARYRLLDTLRQYGWQRLVDSGESEAIRRAHAGCYLALAEEAEPELTGAGQQAWLERLEREHDNLRVALMWAVEREEAETGLRLGGALGRFWMVRGYLSEGRQRLAAVLALAGASGRRAVRARALHEAGRLARDQSDFPAARALLQESLAIYRELADKRGTAFVLTGLGRVAREQGDYGAARGLIEESLAIYQELGDKQGIAEALNHLGVVARDQGAYPMARALYEESLAICRELGDKRDTAIALNNLGRVARGQGDYPAARVLHEESLTIYRELGDKRDTAIALGNLGRVAREQGDYGAARALVEESLAISQELGDKRDAAMALQDLGLVARDQGDCPTARARSEESLALFRELGHKRGIAEALTSLGDVLRQQGDLGQAAARYEESLAMARAGGLQAHVAWAQHGLGHVALRAQHPRQARTCFAESLALFCAQESKRGIAYGVAGLAGVAAAEGRLEQAARLFGAAEALLEALGVAVPLAERAASGRDGHLAAVRAALGEASFAAAWAAGQALPLERASAEALEAVGDSPLPVRRAVPSAPPGASTLSTGEGATTSRC